MKTPRISFYMTVKDGGRHVRGAIDSIRKQDIDDWEFVIVDDHSTDDTETYLKEVSEADRRIRVRRSLRVGRGQALNVALSMCRSSIAANIDADDLAHPSRARLTLRFFEDNPGYAVISGRSELISDSDQPTWLPETDRYNRLVNITRRLAYKNPISHSAVGVQCHAVREVGGYDESRISQLDYELWVRLAASGYQLGRSARTLAAKRIHPDQSFERRRHLTYAFRSSKVRWKAIQVLGVSRVVGGCFIAASLGWACLPQGVRMKVRRIYNRVAG